MSNVYRINDDARFSGYIDLDGRYISFKDAEEVFTRARANKARVLLRLSLDEDGLLQGIFYTNDFSLIN